MTINTNLTTLALAAAFATMAMLASSAPAKAAQGSGTSRVSSQMKGYLIGLRGHADSIVISSSRNATGNTLVTPHNIKRPVDVYSPHFYSPPPPPLGKPLKGRT